MHLVLVTCIIVNNSAELIEFKTCYCVKVTVRCVCKTENGLKRRVNCNLMRYKISLFSSIKWTNSLILSHKVDVCRVIYFSLQPFTTMIGPKKGIVYST